MVEKTLVGYFFGPDGIQPIYRAGGAYLKGAVSKIRFTPEFSDLNDPEVRKSLTPKEDKDG